MPKIQDRREVAVTVEEIGSGRAVLTRNIDLEGKGRHYADRSLLTISSAGISL